MIKTKKTLVADIAKRKNTPLALNTNAPSYKKIKQVFDKAADKKVNWRQQSSTLFAAKFDVNAYDYSIASSGELTVGYKEITFYIDELEAISPSLAYMLAKTLSPRMKDWFELTQMETIWMHLHHPGVGIDETNRDTLPYEKYMKELVAIHHIDFIKETLLADVLSYRIVYDEVKEEKSWLKKLAGNIIKTPKKYVVGSALGLSKTSALKLSLPQLEIIFPGLSNRVKLAQDLGLDSTAMATFAMYGVKKEQAITLPDYLSVSPTI